MNFAGIVMFLIGLFGLVLFVLGALSIFQDGNIPLVSIKYGGSFLAIVGLFFVALGFIGFARMRRPNKHD